VRDSLQKDLTYLTLVRHCFGAAGSYVV